jgi:hypothetical protein
LCELPFIEMRIQKGRTQKIYKTYIGTKLRNE